MMHRHGAADFKGTLVVVLLVGGLIGLLIWLTPQSIRHQKTEQQCRFRLRRVSLAIQAWVIDHNREAFPPIENPEPRTPWQPGRAGSLGVVLSEYLSGDDELFRPQRQAESEEAYIERLRARELTCCPVTGYEYWYNAGDLRRNVPARLGVEHPTSLAPSELPDEGNSERLLLIRCQSQGDGSPPHPPDDGGNGHYGAFMYPVVRQVLPSHVAEERRRLDAAEQRNAGKPMEEWSVDLLSIRQQVEALERQIERHPEGFIVTQLAVEVDELPAR